MDRANIANRVPDKFFTSLDLNFFVASSHRVSFRPFIRLIVALVKVLILSFIEAALINHYTASSVSQMFGYLVTNPSAFTHSSVTNRPPALSYR
jgi:hypothetical protein